MLALRPLNKLCRPDQTTEQAVQTDVSMLALRGC